HHHCAGQGLRARGVSPDGQRSDVDHVGRADPHGALGSPADGAGDRWDHGLRVSGDVSHVHATEWILRRRARERGPAGYGGPYWDRREWAAGGDSAAVSLDGTVGVT